MEWHNGRRLPHSRQQRKTVHQRPKGWQEEEIIEQFDSPQEDNAPDNETWDDIQEDFDEGHHVTKEVNAKRRGDRKTGCAAGISYAKNKHRQRQNPVRCNSPSSSYRPPLEVWRRRYGTSCPVDNERMIVSDRKTILYGQTPSAMCKIQFNAMAEAAGVTLSQFSRLVLEGGTKEHLLLLRQYHTLHLPELSQLFDELDVCASSENFFEQTVNNEQNNISFSDKAGVTDKAVAGPCKVSLHRKSNEESKSEVSEICRKSCNNYLRIKKRKAYEQLQTVNESRKDVSKNSNVKGDDHQEVVEVNLYRGEDQYMDKKSRKGFEATLREKTKGAKPAIPDTESEASTSSESDSDPNGSDFIPPSPQSREEQVTQNINTVKSPYHKRLSQCTRIYDNKIVHFALEPAAVSCNSASFQESQLRRERQSRKKNSLSPSVDILDSFDDKKNISLEITSDQTNEMYDFHYNSVLAGLLFKDEISTTSQNKTKNCHKGQVLGHNSDCNQSDKLNCSTDLHRINTRKTKLGEKITGVSTKSAECYNRVLDTLLFGDCSSLPLSQPDQSGVGTVCTSQTLATTTTQSQVYHSSNTSNHLKHITDELVGSPQYLNKKYAGKSAHFLDTALDHGSRRPFTLSQDLKESPWATLEM